MQFKVEFPNGRTVTIPHVGLESEAPPMNGKPIAPSGLGDYTEAVLKAVGVTKERYAAAKELFGLSPTCNCQERKEWLNKVSAWWLGL